MTRANKSNKELRYKLKPNTHIHEVTLLQEFFSQFNLIAWVNRWNDATKTVA